MKTVMAKRQKKKKSVKFFFKKGQHTIRQVLKIGQLMGLFTQRARYYKSALALVFQITAGYKNHSLQTVENLVFNCQSVDKWVYVKPDSTASKHAWLNVS